MGGRWKGAQLLVAGGATGAVRGLGGGQRRGPDQRGTGVSGGERGGAGAAGSEDPDVIRPTGDSSLVLDEVQERLAASEDDLFPAPARHEQVPEAAIRKPRDHQTAFFRVVDRLPRHERHMFSVRTEAHLAQLARILDPRQNGTGLGIDDSQPALHVPVVDERSGSQGHDEAPTIRREEFDLGVYGAPETYLLDAEGVIRYRHVGVVDERVWETILQPLYRDLLTEATL